MRNLFGKAYHSMCYKHFSIRPLTLYKNKAEKEVVLPDDDAFLSGQEVQWWYWTGHLHDENHRRYGFEIVFFAFDSWLFFKNQLVQAAITDVDRQSYHYREDIEYCKLPKLLDGKFHLGANKGDRTIIAAFGGNGKDSLYCEVDDYVLDINLQAVKEPVIHYDGKAHPYSFGGYTYYYSRKRMKTEGTIKVKDKKFKVHGVSWFDRQYGDLYSAIFKGWQWFAIELFDGRAIMLYDFLGQDCLEEKFGSITYENSTKKIEPHEYEVLVLGEWQCPRTNIKFPSGWKIKLEGMELTVEPLVKDQALRAKHVFWIGPEYWEGACNVSDNAGNVIGQAYVELNGFGRKLISIEVKGLGNVDFGI